MAVGYNVGQVHLRNRIRLAVTSIRQPGRRTPDIYAKFCISSLQLDVSADLHARLGIRMLSIGTHLQSMFEARMGNRH